MKKTLISLVVATFMLGMMGSAEAIVIVNVDAYLNSLSGGTPLDTGVDVSSGDLLSISVPFNDLWRAGSGPRESNADGLGNPFGYNFGNYTYGGFSFLYGSLVGKIDSGDYFLVGTSFNQAVTDIGRLNLLYWDSNNHDNSGFVTATIDVTPIPEPASLSLLGLGMLGLLGIKRKRKKL